MYIEYRTVVVLSEWGNVMPVHLSVQSPSEKKVATIVPPTLLDIFRKL
jgi:hypothetical protein